MNIECKFYLKVQALNAKEFLKKSMKAQNIFMSHMMDGWR